MIIQNINQGPQLLREVCADRAITPAAAKRAKLRLLSRDEARQASEHGWLPGPAVEIPYLNEAGLHIFTRWKIFDHPTIRYVSKSGAGSKVYFPPNRDLATWANDCSQDVYIVEGELKTLAAADNLDVVAIGIAGVWNFIARRGLSERSTPIPDLDLIEWRERKVTICYDSDWRTNQEVRRALLVLGIELTSRGAQVSILDLPGTGPSKTGLDDWIVAHRGTKKALRDAFRDLSRVLFDPADFFDGLSDLDMARRLRLHYSDVLRFVPQVNAWYVLNSATNFWTRDEMGEAERIAKRLPDILIREAGWTRNPDRRNEILGAAKVAGNKRRLDAALSLLKTEEGIPLRIDALDKETQLFALPEGRCIDLTSGTERLLRADDYVTKVAGTSIAAATEAIAPTFTKFINDIFLGDQQYVEYVKRALGYTLSGETSEQCIFILHGFGANGKSTLLNLLRAVLGDYAMHTNPETFTVQQANGARGDLVRLRGARFIATSELEDGQRLAESIIKQWTGGEPIVARQLYCEPFEFSVVGKIFIATNHKPRVRGTDHAIWRRIHLWPFDLTVAKAQQDPHLIDKLRVEMPAILRWMVDGFVEWRRIGLRPPSKVLTATDSYRTENDLLNSWLEECCIRDKSLKCYGPTLFTSFERYMLAAGEKYIHSRRDFFRLLSERGFESSDTTDRKKREKGKFFHGINVDQSTSDSMNSLQRVRKF